MAGRPRVPSATRPPEVDADWQSQANRRGPGVDQRRGDEAAAAAEIRYGTCGGRRPDAHATWRRSVETVQHSRAIFQSTNIIGYSIITNFPFSFGTIATPCNSVNSLIKSTCRACNLAFVWSCQKSLFCLQFYLHGLLIRGYKRVKT